ncbi:hypothetical protein BDR06DRAFT_967409 [Suillus hirtellus]|nr:hypothetical protein BDR06DRAFT_967409 [Suillus hirtellus]
MSTMSDQIDSLDILNLLPPLPAKSKDTIALRAEVGELSAQLAHMLQLAPSQDNDEHIPEKEEWLKTFSDVKNQVAKHLMLMHDNKVVINLLVSTRQDWQKGDLLCTAFQSQVTTFKDGVAMEMVDTSTTATGPPPVTTTTTTSTAPAPATITTTSTAPTTAPTTTSTECTPATGRQKKMLRMSAEKAIHEVPCANCKKLSRTCHVTSIGESCYKCCRGKVKCSHVRDKGKKKIVAPPSPPSPAPPFPTPPPPPLATKPKPRLKPVVPTSHPIQASSKATQVPGPASAVAPAQPQLVPGPRSIQNNTYIELQMSTKQKVTAIKEKESGSEDGEEEAYLASWVSGLSNILQMIEMACATMRKEVEEINGRVTNWYTWNSMWPLWIGFGLIGISIRSLQMNDLFTSSVQLACAMGRTSIGLVRRLPLGTGPYIWEEISTWMIGGRL